MSTFQSQISSKKGGDQKQLVNFSVRAQDFITKQGMNKTEDVSGLGSIIGGGANGSVDTTNVSNDPSFFGKKSKFASKLDPLGPFQLPKINAQNQSPFKGFIDISVVSQKLRKGVGTSTDGKMRGNHSVKGGLGNALKKDNFFGGNEDYGEQKNNKVVGNRGKSQSGDRGVKMSAEVLETWINETLQDAEHLDIPGVIVKPEHKDPISRYGIDRLMLRNASIPNDVVDRVYRALFVYSVGFHELIKKCLEHTEKKYTIITSIWKVFSILLEYCCRTDYRMLISEISREHEEKMEAIESMHNARFQEQANNEKTLKQNMEMLQKYSETLEKDRANEKQMRLKLEEEYMQNTKNHEEEVQLRLKFESKLNNMHSAHRDLETKFKRTRQDLAKALEEKSLYQDQVGLKIDEITDLKTKNTEQASKITNLKEKVESLQRDLSIKSDQLGEFEQRTAKTLDELDLVKYKLQEQQKELTEMKLKTDVLTSTNDGLTSERAHLTVELKETRDLQKSYENKCSELIVQLNEVQSEYQTIRKRMIGADELAREREERIENYKKELIQYKVDLEKLTIEHESLKINHSKVLEQYEACRKDLDDTTDKLHLTNKVRHETEIKLGEEVEKCKGLQEIVKVKEDSLGKKATEIEELDKRVIDLERAQEALDIKKQGIERQLELSKKQATEKIASLNEIIAGEKETREMWIERYEKEQQDHTATNAQLLETKSELKDQILATKSHEIKLQTVQRQVDLLSSHNKKHQTTINETQAKHENIERELNTQKEILKQFEQSKKEYIARLKRELETVEERFVKMINQNIMVGEDYRSQAVMNLNRLITTKIELKSKEDELAYTQGIINEKQDIIDSKEKEFQDHQMVTEDFFCQILYKSENIAKLSQNIADQKATIEELTFLKDEQKQEIDDLGANSKKVQQELKQAYADLDKSNKVIENLNIEFEDYKVETEDQIAELKLQIQDRAKSPDKVPEEKVPSVKAPSVRAPSEKAPSEKAPSEKAPSEKAPSEKAPSEKAPSEKALEVEKVEVKVEVEKIVEKIVHVHKDDVPKGEAECQTDIAMDYFDRPQMAKTDSRASGGSNKQRVGGGGSIVKPPKAVQKQNSTKVEDLMNVTGHGSNQGHSNQGHSNSQISKKSGGSVRNLAGSQQALPNLLKNSHQSIAQSINQELPTKRSIPNEEVSARNLEDMKNKTLVSSLEHVGHTDEGNSTQLATILSQNLANKTINPNEVDAGTISARMIIGGKESIEHEVIKEEDEHDIPQFEGLQHKTSGTIVAGKSSRGGSNHGRRSSVQKVVHQNPQVISKETLSKNQSEDPQNESRHSEHMQGSMNSSQKHVQRMKVNINNQEVINDEPDNSYLSNTGIAQPQMIRQLQQQSQRNQGTLQQSIKMNNKKVTGASSIRTLIKSAATRD